MDIGVGGATLLLTKSAVIDFSLLSALLLSLHKLPFTAYC